MYNLSIYDLSEQTRLVWYSSEDDIKMCVMKGKDEVSAIKLVFKIFRVVTSRRPPSRLSLFIIISNTFTHVVWRRPVRIMLKATTKLWKIDRFKCFGHVK